LRAALHDLCARSHNSDRNGFVNQKVDDNALEFLNGLSGTLVIELTEPAQQAAPHLMNLVAPKTARIKSVAMDFSVYEGEDDRKLTDEEWSRVVIHAPRIRMRSVDTEDIVVDHDAPNGSTFTVRNLADAIAKTERDSREHGEWLGGIDVHHVFFEGIELEDDVWTICWGS
jgi:hypothetical protein